MSTAQRSPDRSPDRRSPLPDMHRSASGFGLAVAAAGVLAMLVSVHQTWWVFEYVARLAHVSGGGAAAAVEVATGMFAALTPLASGRELKIRVYVWTWFSTFVSIPIFCNWLHSVYDPTLTPVDLAGNHPSFDPSGFKAGGLVDEHLTLIRLALACAVPITGAVCLHAYSFRKRHSIGADAAVLQVPAVAAPAGPGRLRLAWAWLAALPRRVAPAALIAAAAALVAAVGGAAFAVAHALAAAVGADGVTSIAAGALAGTATAGALGRWAAAVARARRSGRHAAAARERPPAPAADPAPPLAASSPAAPALPAAPRSAPDRPAPAGRPTAARSRPRQDTAPAVPAVHPHEPAARRLYDQTVRRQPGIKPNAAKLLADLAADVGMPEGSAELPGMSTARRWVREWWGQAAESPVRAVG